MNTGAAKQMEACAAGKKIPIDSEETCKNTAMCTPTVPKSRETPVVMNKTPLSVMSSSLKERLKKCGRYHPATPTTSGHCTSLSSQRRTPSSIFSRTSVSDSRTGSSLSLSQACNNSPVSTKRKLPQPRNILMEKSNLNSSDTSDRDTSNTPVVLAEDETRASLCVGNTVQNEKKGTLNNQSKTICEKNGSASGDVFSKMSSSLDCSPSYETETMDVVSVPEREPAADRQTASPPVDVRSAEGHVSDRKEHLAQNEKDSKLSNCEDFKVSRQQLHAELVERKEVLRKLHMVKTYRAKNNLNHLQGLIDKWRSACQEAVLDLHQQTSHAQPSLTQLVRQLGIDTELLCFDEEEECFDAS